MAKLATTPKALWQPFERAALICMGVLALLILLLIFVGDSTKPQVRSFSWRNQQVGVEDTAFVLNFNRPMNWDTVAQGLTINPPLPGKVSWSGRRFAYTLNEPIAYGKRFELSLNGATDRQGNAVVPFQESFNSRALAFAYVGGDGAGTGKIILVNPDRGKKQILTPESLSVVSFKPYQKGDRILFTAREGTEANANANLYRVTTGLDSKQPAGKVEKVLDGTDYQILKFDLSTDGERIVLQRAGLRNIGAVGLWQLKSDGALEQLNIQNAGDFLIAPDSRTVVVAQGQGLALVPLDKTKGAAPLDFLPQYGMVMGFSRDGAAAAMVKFNTDFTRSLFLVNIQGTQKELLREKSSILEAMITPKQDAVYCILTRLQTGEGYRELPYLSRIDLKTGKKTDLMNLTSQGNTTLSMAPDGSNLLFDQVSMDAKGDASMLWTFNIDPDFKKPPTPDDLKAIAPGSSPQWLP
jgi:Tol biopolymer transport system component